MTNCQCWKGKYEGLNWVLHRRSKNELFCGDTHHPHFNKMQKTNILKSAQNKHIASKSMHWAYYSIHCARDCLFNKFSLKSLLSAKLTDTGKQDTALAFRTIMIHSRGDQVKCGGGIWVLKPGQGPPAKWLPLDIKKREHIKETQKGLCWERQLQETEG